MRARKYNPAVTQGAKWYPEDIVGSPQMATGDYFFVDAAKSADGGGKSWDDAFEDLDTAFSTVGSGDVIYIAPGTYTGNYTTEDDTEARNVSVIGVNPGMPGIRGGVNLVPTTSSSPIITANASGWRFSNMCFRPGATSSGITLYANITTQNYIDGVAGGIAQGVTVDNCMFWGGGTGKYGIESQGDEGVNSPHFVNVINNHFMYLNATGGAGIYGALDSNPHIGWKVTGNQFGSNKSDINCATKMGWVGSRFEGNTLGKVGVYANATDGLLHIRATSTPATTGGNMIVGNYFECTKNQYVGYGGENGFVTTNGYDHGIGNYCINGIPTSEINHLQA